MVGLEGAMDIGFAQMSFAPGVRLGHHKILDVIGAAARPVYRALDTALGRNVRLIGCRRLRRWPGTRACPTGAEHSGAIDRV